MSSRTVLERRIQEEKQLAASEKTGIQINSEKKKRMNPALGKNSEMDRQSLCQKLPSAQALTNLSIFSEQRAGLEGSSPDLLVS